MRLAVAPLLRQTFARPLQRQSKRFASQQTNASVEATQKKAQEALASAQQNAGKAWESAQKYAEPLTKKLGDLLGSYKDPLFYNLAVTREVLKQIYVKESLQPPSLAAVRTAYASIWSQVSNPAALRSLAQSGDIARVGIYGLQAYGIFKIGEIVGRRSLIGYDLH
ncbi:mitochondrial ATP synthase g subunit-domain-containing protein [Crucibulum laeve]|uniref:Mitochondrial ATP synthase g subunit-domain-containing protein n=1 Tax=Crucibulum laeve TaxID=68775 RepID=A0A5C3M2K1_9AGAR|nr:mitochondrial ATP synthase g subunit-domain-containing protein [Crucibulum laeve]